MRICVDNLIDIAWETPTSGYGHISDEQPLPFIKSMEGELTPLYGGDANCKECRETSIGLPYGELSVGWPIRQRIFNFHRKPVNKYWRNIVYSRCRQDLMFFFWEQLKFKTTKKGFRGVSPVLEFERVFTVFPDSILVEDITFFYKKISFKTFFPIVIPLFNSWSINGFSTPRLVTNDIKLNIIQKHISAAGVAELYAEEQHEITYASNETLKRSYIYVFR